MISISISENKIGAENLYYIQSAVGEMLKSANCTLKNIAISDRVVLQINCPEYYLDIIKIEILDKIAEIITVKYKYNYFKSNLKVCGLYVFDRLTGFNEIAIDGIYNFRLRPLKKKWEDIIGYMPQCFLTSQLYDFITYLLESKKKRVYIDNGKVFDCHYKRLKRCSLINYDKVNLIREVILSNCGEIEISGKLPEEDERYIKQFYGDKIIFSTGYMS